MSCFRIRPRLARTASWLVISTIFGSATIAQAQDPASQDVAPDDTIVVTGIRASLDRAIELKRNSSGVVDGISAEEIGKFPDTNLAESLQRIPGVSIDRVNGEGSLVTVRGFGPGYNLVTLNGRTLPTASLASVGQDQNGDFISGTTRSFDFANLASEGVSRLEVYKTARAAIPSGGIGAAINIVTRRPLDSAGLVGSIGAKAVYDTGDTYDYARVTPEVSGIIDWSNPDRTFGIGLFASYQKRNNSLVTESGNDWNITPYSAFIGAGSPYINASTVINNPPSNPDTNVAIPNDTRYDYSEFQRERINGQLTLQFAPSEALEITADGTFYQNDASEQRADQANWYNRPFNEVTFDGNDQVATAVFLDDIISSPKDGGFEQQYRATRDRLYDFGINARLKATDRLTLVLDGHYGKAEAQPHNPRGNSSTLFSMAYKGVADQTMTIVDGFPQQNVTFNDNPPNGNGNGILDLPDLGTQVARSVTSSQEQTLGEARFDGIWDVGDDDRVSFGAGYRDSDMKQSRIDTYDALGDWGVGAIGDVAARAANLVQEYCLVCQFKDYNTGSTGVSLTAFRGDATKLFDTFVTNPTVNGFQNNEVKEKIWSVYAQVEINTKLLDRPANIVAGVRYERTNSRSISGSSPPPPSTGPPTTISSRRSTLPTARSPTSPPATATITSCPRSISRSTSRTPSRAASPTARRSPGPISPICSPRRPRSRPTAPRRWVVFPAERSATPIWCRWSRTIST